MEIRRVIIYFDSKEEMDYVLKEGNFTVFNRSDPSLWADIEKTHGLTNEEFVGLINILSHNFKECK